jgi:phospholipid-binding lipoprotein MlaA
MQQILLLAAVLVLTGCAHSGERLDRVAVTEVAKRDPWEPANRGIYKFSTAVDRAVLLPITNGYRFIVPEAGRNGIRNVYDTLQEPTNFANAVAQGKIKSAFRALDRLLINGFLGLGVADHATGMGLESQPHDFGQTLAVWQVPSGPYLMLPFLGPSTARDAPAFFVDFILDPVDFVKNRIFSTQERYGQLAIRIIDTRAGLRDQGEQLLIGSADEYATIRSAWLQRRRYEIFDGNLPAEEEDELDLPPPSDPAPLPSEPPAADNATAPSTPAAADPVPAPPPA